MNSTGFASKAPSASSQDCALAGPLQDRFRLAQIGHDQRVLDAWDFLDDLQDLIAGWDGLAVVVVAVAGDQQLGPDLPEAVENAAHAEIGRCARPDGAERGGREEANDGFGHVGHKRRDPVALANPPCAHRLLRPADRRVQGGPAQRFPPLALAPENQRRTFVIFAQEIFGIVKARAFKKFCILKTLTLPKNWPGSALSNDAQEVPGLRPEGFGLADGEGVKIGVCAAIGSEGGVDFRHECGHARGVHGRLRRLPEGRCFHVKAPEFGLATAKKSF